MPKLFKLRSNLTGKNTRKKGKYITIHLPNERNNINPSSQFSRKFKTYGETKKQLREKKSNKSTRSKSPISKSTRSKSPISKSPKRKSTSRNSSISKLTSLPGFGSMNNSPTSSYGFSELSQSNSASSKTHIHKKNSVSLHKKRLKNPKRGKTKKHKNMRRQINSKSVGFALRKRVAFNKEIQKNTQDLEDLSQNIANFISTPEINLKKEIPDTTFNQFGQKFIDKKEEIKTKIKNIKDVTDHEKLLESIKEIINDIVFRNNIETEV